MVVVVVDKESVTVTEGAEVAATTDVMTGAGNEVVNTLDAATDEEVVLAADTVLALTTAVDEPANDC